MQRRSLLLSLGGLSLTLAALPHDAHAASPTIVAAETVYGDIAQQIAGNRATVASLLSNPDQDPHLFEASPSIARSLAGARVVIINGADYDPWAEKLLAASKPGDRRVIVIADLLGAKSGDNPHLWYDPRALPALARALAAALAETDPAHAAEYEQRLGTVLASFKPVEDKIAAMKARYAGTPVTATEPVFGLMADALGLTMRNERFQRAVMNDTEPSASDIAAFEADLKNHAVRVLFYNSQASDAAARRLLGIAKSAGVPVLGVTETKPAGKTAQAWFAGELDALDKILAKPAA